MLPHFAIGLNGRCRRIGKRRAGDSMTIEKFAPLSLNITPFPWYVLRGVRNMRRAAAAERPSPAAKPSHLRAVS
jgi:hypothetical protein